MCRLAYVPFSAGKEDEELIGILYDFLEVSFGGHGNGIGYFVDRKPWIYKGATLKTDLLATFMAEQSLSTIFHTRMASMGSICDENTHPFSYNGVLTAHNGHWMDAKEMAKMLIHAEKFSKKRLENMTDSEVIACLIGNYGFGATDIVNTGVILSLYPDHAKVFVKGDFEVIKTPEGRYLYASEFPKRIIDEWKVKDYYKFDSGTIAKLTADGPILVRGGLSKTVPSAWPTYKRGGYSRQDLYDDWYGGYYGGNFREATPPRKEPTQRLSFLPKRKGKKAKRKPYTAREIMWEVRDHIGFDVMPEVDALIDSAVHCELEASLEELDSELVRVLSTKRFCKQNKGWLAEEANSACVGWLRVNGILIKDYLNAKTQLESSFMGENLHGDSYSDGFGNLWIFFNEVWVLADQLTEDQKEEVIQRSGA